MYKITSWVILICLKKKDRNQFCNDQNRVAHIPYVKGLLYLVMIIGIAIFAYQGNISKKDILESILYLLSLYIIIIFFKYTTGQKNIDTEMEDTLIEQTMYAVKKSGQKVKKADETITDWEDQALSDLESKIKNYHKILNNYLEKNNLGLTINAIIIIKVFQPLCLNNAIHLQTYFASFNSLFTLILLILLMMVSKESIKFTIFYIYIKLELEYIKNTLIRTTISIKEKMNKNHKKDLNSL